MKNFLMIACVAVCTVFMSANTSYALGGGGNGGGGGGKTASSARVVVTNTEAVAGASIAVWVRSAGTRVPSTVGALRSQLIFLSPGETRNTNNLRNGSYLITTVDADSIALLEGSIEIDQDDVDLVSIDTQAFDIEGVDRTVDVDSNSVDVSN